MLPILASSSGGAALTLGCAGGTGAALPSGVSSERVLSVVGASERHEDDSRVREEVQALLRTTWAS